MGWITLSLRRNELQTSIQDLQYELIKLNAQKTRLSNFSAAIGDGKITPSEIASVGSELFGEALSFTENSDMAATMAAGTQTDYYCSVYGKVTQQQYMNNPNVANGANLYFDDGGNLNQAAIFADLYDEALKDFVETVVAPRLNELEKEMENKQTQLETELESQEAELQVVKESVSKNIQSSTIKL